MARSKLYALARSLTLAASVGAPCLAQAADLLPPPPPPPLAPPPVEVGGGWYLRGDVGVGALELRKSVAEDVSVPAKPYKYKTIQDRIGDQAFAGVGVGYQINPWLRVDATGEYRTKTEWSFIALDRTFGPGKGYNQTQGKFASVVGLVNGYIDLGTWYGVTPFVGGGVGFAHHMFGETVDTGYGDYAGGIGAGKAHDKTSLAWAAHAGLGYAVTPNLKLEVAYRYLNMGDAETGTVTCLPSCPLKTVYKVKELDSHDVKVGFRYLLGGVGVAAMPPLEPVYQPMPGPLVRKY